MKELSDMTSAERKTYPMYRGLLVYFPDALLEVCHVSYVANEQHNPGDELHWAKEKSSDEEDAQLRHLAERAKGIKYDVDNLRHLAKNAWRALGALQREIDADRKFEFDDAFQRIRHESES